MKIKLAVFVGFVLLCVAWWQMQSGSSSSRSREEVHRVSRDNPGAIPQVERTDETPAELAVETSERPAIAVVNKPGARQSAPGASVMSVLGHKYANAREEHTSIVEAVRASGQTSEPWTDEAKGVLIGWTRDWPTGVDLVDVECFVDGCVGRIESREPGATRQQLSPSAPDGAWGGGVLQLASYEDEYGLTITALVLLNPVIR